MWGPNVDDNDDANALVWSISKGDRCVPLDPPLSLSIRKLTIDQFVFINDDDGGSSIDTKNYSSIRFEYMFDCVMCRQRHNINENNQIE